MTGIDSVVLESVIVHKVGNPTRSEQLVLSNEALIIDDHLVTGLLTKYFLTPFNEAEHYQFSHLSDLSFNEVYTYVQTIFNEPDTFVEQSKLLANFLHAKSTHVKVKDGELYVAKFTNLPFGTEFISGIGLFKSETKETFLQLKTKQEGWGISAEDGIAINKLDKGCLIYNKDGADGYVVCMVDNTNKQQDTQYWVNDFLQISRRANSYHYTDAALGMCKLFISNEYQDKFEVTKTDQVDLLHRSMEYFTSHESFNMQDFGKEVLHHPELIESFTQYKSQYEVAKQVVIEDEFSIHVAAVKKQQRFFKAVVKLDKNFHIYIHGRKDLVEKGYDEKSGKQFYKLYFDEES
jgi:hypothetical protein